MTEPAKMSTTYAREEIEEGIEYPRTTGTLILGAMLKQLLAEVDELRSEIAMALAENDALAAQNHQLRDKLRPRSWIPVSERLPDPRQTVIVDGGIARVRLDGTWVTGMEEPIFKRPIDWKVTHWMELPKLPDTEQEG